MTLMPKTSRTWARTEINRLDSRKDAQRIAHLSFETRYGAPILLHALFSVAFAYNVAEPRMARILYRQGKGPIISATRKRNFDSMTFFGELYRYGTGPEGQKIADRLNRIHANFPIDSELFLYTLSTLALLPRRVSERFMQRGGISQKENDAQFWFWRDMGMMLKIENIPDSPDALMLWMLDFEAQKFQPSAEANVIVDALAVEWAEQWAPKVARPLAVRVFYALIEPRIRQRMGWPDPGGFANVIAHLAVRGYFTMKRILPDPNERSITDYFGHTYGRKVDIQQVGVQYDRGTPG